VKAVLTQPWVLQWGDAQGGDVVRMLGEGCEGSRAFHEARERRKKGESKGASLFCVLGESIGRREIAP
jgi:hypothetical protein